jgi:hypothetical protein
VLFALLGLVGAGIGALLAVLGVTEAQWGYGCIIPIVLYMGIQLKTGMLLIGRSWSVVLTTKDKHPRICWTVVIVESALFLVPIYRLTTRT